jgi:hypothetical protein
LATARNVMSVLTEKQIEEIFRELGLLEENERARILSQGRVHTKIESKLVYNVVSDNVTTPQDKQVNL